MCSILSTKKRSEEVNNKVSPHTIVVRLYKRKRSNNPAGTKAHFCCVFAFSLFVFNDYLLVNTNVVWCSFSDQKVYKIVLCLMLWSATFNVIP